MHEPPFDPYHKWLGIPPKDQPPDHYRLLGLERFESDPDVIAHAADARMTHIKTLATGAFSHLSQELLNAISAARVCLLNPQTKAQYDTALWQWLEQQRMAAAAPVPPPLPGEQPPPMQNQGLRARMLALVAVGVAVCGLLLVAVVVLLRSGRETAVVVEGNQTPTTVATPVVSGVPSLETTEASGRTPEKPVEKSQPVTTEEATPKKVEPKQSKPTPPVTEKMPETAKPPTVETPGEESSPSTPATPAANPEPSVPASPKTVQQDMPPKPPVAENAASKPEMKPEAKPEVKPEPPASTDAPPQPTQLGMTSASARGPIPSVDQQAKIQRQVDDVYKPTEADTPQKKLELAEKMFATGEETRDDPVSRYVLMRSAWRLAGDAGNLDLALDMIDRAHEWYEYDPLGIKVETLERAERSLGSGPDADIAGQQLIQKAMALVDVALHVDDFQTATNLLEKIAAPAARRTSDKQLASELTKRRAQVRRQREEFAEVEKAQETLASNEADQDANLTVGRWHCLVKGDWNRGLPYLAKGSDDELAGLAQRELAGVTSSQSQVELADAWWELSEQAGPKQKESAVAQLRARAAHWYRQALPFLTGIFREKAEKRLADMSTTSETRGEYALEFDGWKSHAIVDFGYAGTCPITIEAIVKPADPPTPNAGTIIGNFDRTGTTGLMLTCQATLWGFCFVEMQQPQRPGRNTPPPGVLQRLHGRGAGRNQEWYHVAGVFDGKQLRLYVDGVLQESRPVSGIHKPTTKLPFVVGAAPAVGPSGVLLDDYFKGLIKSVRISSVARYTDNFSPPTQLTRDDSNTQLLLVFNKGSGDVVPDTSGRRNSMAGAGGRKRAGTSTAKLVGTKWVPLNTTNSDASLPSDRRESR